MSTTGRVECVPIRRKFVIFGHVTAEALVRAIAVAEAERGTKVLRYGIEWADAPKRVKVRDYMINTSLPFSPPDDHE